MMPISDVIDAFNVKDAWNAFDSGNDVLKLLAVANI